MPREMTEAVVERESLRVYPANTIRVSIYAGFKRFFDVVFSLILLAVFSPLFLVIAVMIKIDSPGPVLFKQKRTGLNGKEFSILKFRSMVKDNDVYDRSCGDKYTRVGKVIRKTSLDELPQFLNVLVGQMSFVGPRPWVLDYYSNMNEEERRRYSVRPGITGLAAAKGRNGLSVFEKIKYDLEYVDNFSLWQDIKVVGLTVKTVVSREEAEAGKKDIFNDILDLKNQNKIRQAGLMQPRKPLVSIIVPAFNCERVIFETIDSIWKQTYKNWELIIVDDKSTDDTKRLLKKIKSKRIRVIFARKNGGAAKARNRGIMAANGRFICFLDADDLWRPEKLEKQVAFMMEKDTAFSFTGYEFADENGVSNGKVVRVPKTISYKQALKNTTIWTSTVMFDMEKLTKREILMPDIKSEDTATWWNVLKIVDHAYGIDEALSIYRRGGKTLSSNKLVAIGRIWNLYRNYEGLGLVDSSANFVGYAFNAVKRRV